MKHFLQNVLAAFFGMLIFSVVASVIAFIGFAGMIASAASSSSVSLKDGSVLVLKLDGVMTERSTDPSPVDYLQGNGIGTVGLTDMLSAIHKAKDNDKIKGIYMEGGELLSDFSQKQELRNALADFKKSGKWIIAYSDMYGVGNYYIASVADKVYLNPQGMIEWNGLNAQIPLLKDFFAKIGIKFMAFKCGKYKSATEQYTEDKLSDPAREQETRLISLEWQELCNAVSKSRGISVDSLNSYADRMVMLDDPKNFVKAKMIDGLLYSDQIKDVIKKRLNIDADDKVPQVTVADMQSVDNNNEGDAVAVYYASGTIYDVSPDNSMLQRTECIVGNDVVEDLNELADDDDIKAVVLRVNSPGGSAYASEQIWRAVEQLKKKKPVVVSMSGAAASGGYYISSGANYIFADPTTITGSIGIFGILPDGSDLVKNKLGIKFDGMKTNRNSEFLSTSSLFGGLLSVGTEPLTAEQASKFQGYINRGYLTFKSRVAQGRHLSMNMVEEIAQGHVYMASDAIKLKLVDELGGLDKAVAKAAQLAKIDKYHAVDYPEPKDFISQLLDDSDKKASYLDEQMKLSLGNMYEPVMLIRTVNCLNPLQARLPYFTNKMN